jgi:hypothetical protein
VVRAAPAAEDAAGHAPARGLRGGQHVGALGDAVPGGVVAGRGAVLGRLPPADGRGRLVEVAVRRVRPVRSVGPSGPLLEGLVEGLLEGLLGVLLDLRTGRTGRGRRAPVTAGTARVRRAGWGHPSTSSPAPSSCPP